MSVTIVDSTLRDGMHSVAHRFTPTDMANIAGGLDAAGVDVIEVGHGDGLGGSSLQYGLSEATDAEYLEAVIGAVRRARVAVLLLPGIGTIDDLEAAHALGATVVRVATHCTEADIAQQHIGWAREHGMTAAAFLMMSHMLEPDQLAEQAQLMESYGAQVVYVVDSAGALVPDGAVARVRALRAALDCEVGFHAHNNLGCGVGNALAAQAAGATWLDGSLRGLGAGAGNAATEVLAAALERSGVETGIDLFAAMDASEDVLAPLLDRQPALIDRAALTIGYAGVYSSFLLHTERAAARFGVPAREILVELGARRMVGGQEDQIIAVAAEMAAVGATGTGD